MSGVLVLSGCGTNRDATVGPKHAIAAPVSELPPSVANGVGSQYGNYAAQMEGETRGNAGERCVLFNWDRPLTKDLALRLKSASCEPREGPGLMVCTEISRTVMPVGESNLRDEVIGTNQ